MLLSFPLLVLMIGISNGAVINVSPSDDLWSKYFYASPGDTLLLANGVYKPDSQTEGSALVINKDITFRAKNAGYAVIDGNGTKRVFLIHSGQVVLDGLNITTGNSSSGAGALIQDGDVLIKNCYMFNHILVKDDLGAAVHVQGGTVRLESTNVFKNLVFHNKYRPTHGGAVGVANGTGTISIDNFTGIHDNFDAGRPSYPQTNCVGFTDPACGRAGPPFPPSKPPTPPATKYVCHLTNYQCVADPSGDFPSQTDCTAKCTPPAVTYACQVMTKTCVQDPMGEFPALANCTANCV